MVKKKIEGPAAVSEEIITSPKSRPFLRRMKLLLGIVLLTTLVLVGSAYYFHWFGVGLSDEAREKRQALRYQTEISKLILVPSEELPVVATVSDAESLRTSQKFYSQVENGDVLLIYSAAQRAVLYRPSKHILVNVGPIYIDNKAEPTAHTNDTIN